MKRRQRKFRSLMTIFIALLFVGLVSWGYAKYSAQALKLVVVQAGTLRHEVQVKAIFANEETPILAGSAGKVNFSGPDGQRFRRGETVGSILPVGAAPSVSGSSGSGTILVAPHGGLLYHEVDGLEAILTPEALQDADLAKLLAQTGNEHVVDTVQAGGVAGKIVNNLKPTYAFLELPDLTGIKEGSVLHFKIDDKDQTASVLKESAQPQGVVVQFSQFVDGSVRQRQQEVLWISKPETSGVLVPKSALWVRGEEQGVYIIAEGVIRFRRVTILDEDSNQACVKELPSGITIVANPRDGLDGTPSN